MPSSVQRSYSASPPSSSWSWRIDVGMDLLTRNFWSKDARTFVWIPVMSSSDAEIAARPYRIVGIFIGRWKVVASVGPIQGDFNHAANESALNLRAWIAGLELPEGDNCTPRMWEEFLTGIREITWGLAEPRHRWSVNWWSSFESIWRIRGQPFSQSQCTAYQLHFLKLRAPPDKDSTFSHVYATLLRRVIKSSRDMWSQGLSSQLIYHQRRHLQEVDYGSGSRLVIRWLIDLEQVFQVCSRGGLRGITKPPETHHFPADQHQKEVQYPCLYRSLWTLRVLF